MLKHIFLILREMTNRIERDVVIIKALLEDNKELIIETNNVMKNIFFEGKTFSRIKLSKRNDSINKKGIENVKNST